MITVIINLQHALHPLLHIVYQVIVGIIKQIKNAIGYYQEKDLQTLLPNGSCSLYCNVRMDGDQVVSQNISTFSGVEWPIILVMFKNFFVAGQVFLWTLRKSSYRFYTLSVVSILILLMLLWFIGDCSAGEFSLWMNFFVAGQVFLWTLRKSSYRFYTLSVVSILILLMLLWFIGDCSAGAILSLDGYQVLSLVGLSAPSCVYQSTNLVTFKDVFGWASLPLDLLQERLSFCALSVVSILILLLFLWFTGIARFGTTLSLDGYQAHTLSLIGFIDVVLC
ncbi:unnamed protein product [Absidia cylindrospora]